MILNYIRKKKSSQIELFNIGVSSKKGQAELKVYEKESINSFESLNPNSAYSKIKNNLLKLKATHETHLDNQASGNQKLLDLGLTQAEATALTGYTPPIEE